MPLVRFHELMADADRGGYAVGCFETWSVDSLLAVADAAENMNSPAILGVSGSYAPYSSPDARDHLSRFAEIGLDICRRLRVPACLMFNESAHLSSVSSAIEFGFDIVRYENQQASSDIERQIVRGLRGWAHHFGSCVESRPQLVAESSGDRRTSGDLAAEPELALTEPMQAEEFVLGTGVDALVVNVVRCHCHNGQAASLDRSRLEVLSRLPVSLVLDEPSSLSRNDLSAAVEYGIRKVNVGKVLRQVYLQVCRRAGVPIDKGDTPLHVVRAGFENSLFPAARFAIQQTIEEYMRVLGSAGRGSRPEFSPRTFARHPSSLVAY
jgi:fructose/tagatose bisphosphate aldolase